MDRITDENVKERESPMKTVAPPLPRAQHTEARDMIHYDLVII